MRIGIAVLFILVSNLLLRKSPNVKWIILVLYSSAIVYFTFLIREPTPIYHYSIKLFGAARKGLEFGGGILEGILTGNVNVVNWMSLEGIILNILLFVPFGYLLPLIWHKADRWWRILLLGFSASLIIELLQLVTRLGYADVDDLINNTFGAMIGWIIYKKVLAGGGQHGEAEIKK